MSLVDTTFGVVGLLLVAGVGAVFLVVGVCLLMGVVKSAREATASAEGRVIGHDVSSDDEGTYYAPVVEFVAAGRVQQIKGALARGGRPEHGVGTVVRVAYPPDRPEAGQLGRWEGWWIAAAVTALGSVFFLVPVVKLVSWLLR